MTSFNWVKNQETTRWALIVAIVIIDRNIKASNIMYDEKFLGNAIINNYSALV